MDDPVWIELTGDLRHFCDPLRLAVVRTGFINDLDHFGISLYDSLCIIGGSVICYYELGDAMLDMMFNVFAYDIGLVFGEDRCNDVQTWFDK